MLNQNVKLIYYDYFYPNFRIPSIFPLFFFSNWKSYLISLSLHCRMQLPWRTKTWAPLLGTSILRLDKKKKILNQQIWVKNMKWKKIFLNFATVISFQNHEYFSKEEP